MRILITQETDWLLRHPAQQHHLAEMLSLRGHEVRVIDYEIDWRKSAKKGLWSREQVFSNVSKTVEGANVTIVRPGIVKIPVLEYISLVVSHRSAIRRQMAEFKPDVIAGFGILNSYLAARIARKNNIPFVYYWIDVLHRLIRFKVFQPVGRLIESQAIRKSDRLFAINEKLKEFVVGLGAPPDKVQVIRAGIDSSQFSPNGITHVVRQQYGIKGDDTVLFFMGLLYSFSGLKEVALHIAERNTPNVKLMIVGEGDDYQGLLQIRDRYQMHDRLILTGRKPYQEMPGFIAASDICILPACPDEKIMHDIVPIKMYEYMAMGKPVLATKLPGVMQEFGQDNGVTYVDRPEDVVEKAIEMVRSRRVEVEGEKAKSFVSKYRWDILTDEFEEALKSLSLRRRKREAVPQ